MRLIFIFLLIAATQLYGNAPTECIAQRETLLAHKYQLIQVYASDVRGMIQFWNDLVHRRQSKRIKLMDIPFIESRIGRLQSATEDRLRSLFWDPIIGERAQQTWSEWRKLGTNHPNMAMHSFRVAITEFMEDLLAAEEIGCCVEPYWADLALLSIQEPWIERHEVNRSAEQRYWEEYGKGVEAAPLALLPLAPPFDSESDPSNPELCSIWLDYWKEKLADRIAFQKNKATYLPKGEVIEGRVEERLTLLTEDPQVGERAKELLAVWKEEGERGAAPRFDQAVVDLNEATQIRLMRYRRTLLGSLFFDASPFHSRNALQQEYVLRHKYRLVEVKVHALENLIKSWRRIREIREEFRQKKATRHNKFLEGERIAGASLFVGSASSEDIKRLQEVLANSPAVLNEPKRNQIRWKKGWEYPSRITEPVLQSAVLDFMQELLVADDCGCDTKAYWSTISLLIAQDRWRARHNLDRGPLFELRCDAVAELPPRVPPSLLPELNQTSRPSSEELCTIWFDHWRDKLGDWLAGGPGDIRIEERLAQLVDDPLIGERAKELLAAWQTEGEAGATPLFDQAVVDFGKSDRSHIMGYQRAILQSLAESGDKVAICSPM